MILRYLKFFLLALVAGLFIACSDDDNDSEFLFNREVTDLSVVRECKSSGEHGDTCFQVRFHYPMETEKLTNIYVWVDNMVLDDTSKAVTKDDLKRADEVIEYQTGTSELYGYVDVSSYVSKLMEEGKEDDCKKLDSLMVAFYCDYSDDEQPGTVQRIYVHFKDRMAPSVVNLRDPETWTTGAEFVWNRPADQTDFYSSGDLSGPIVGYNIVVYALDEDEDIRKVKVKVSNSEGVDSTGTKIYKRHARIRSNTNDSVWVDSVTSAKNLLRIAILDGKGYDTEDFEANAFTLVLEGLKAESRYTIGISSWDSSGNGSGDEKFNMPWSNTMFYTTDSIAPLIGSSILTLKDSAFPELARLDSNNRLRVFWGRSVDPRVKNHGITVDTLLSIPDSCLYSETLKDYQCINEEIEGYYVDYYDRNNKEWVKFGYAGGDLSRYSKRYKLEADTMVADAEEGEFVTDTIRWVAPGDTLILRVRSRDVSGYYSKAVIDTIVVAPSEKAKDVECPEGFILVSTSDTTTFCMERYEHRDDSGTFVNNVLHSEALAACQAMSGSGFTFDLCGEREWELVCLSGGTLSYGVIEESSEDNSDYLFANCNVATNDSVPALDISKRSSRCLNPMGVHDMPGQLQEWVRGRSEDTLTVLKGGSYKVFGGLDRETQARCTNRSFPYYTRPDYTKDTVYLYREGTRVDTVFVADTSRTPYEKKPILTKEDFTDSLQFFNVLDADGNKIGEDYAPYAEYKKGGDEWLEKVANGLTYEPDRVEVVFVKKERIAYRQAAAFYKSPAIGFRCCAYPE